MTPRLVSRLLRVLPANNDDSDNKSASDPSDSELCGVASASVSKGEAADEKHAHYFTLFQNWFASHTDDKYNLPFFIPGVFNQE